MSPKKKQISRNSKFLNDMWGSIDDKHDYGVERLSTQRPKHSFDTILNQINLNNRILQKLEHDGVQMQQNKNMI